MKNTESYTPIRCPKCRSLNLCVSETGTWITKHFLDRTSDNNPGGYYMANGECLDCDWVWRIRGYTDFSYELKQRLERNREILLIRISEDAQ